MVASLFHELCPHILQFECTPDAPFLHALENFDPQNPRCDFVQVSIILVHLLLIIIIPSTHYYEVSQGPAGHPDDSDVHAYY